MSTVAVVVLVNNNNSNDNGIGVAIQRMEQRIAVFVEGLRVLWLLLY